MQVNKLVCAIVLAGLVFTAERTIAQCQTSTGPDVIVGDLSDVGNYGKVNGISGYSIGTTSCNIGTANVNWIAGNNQHPVIGQNAYRYKVVFGAGRFEQIGMSWLKHGFTALTQNLCCTCSGQGGAVLGVGCSDPYVASLNGDQTRLGPRSEVNAATGVYLYPYVLGSNPQSGDAIYKHLQIHDADIEPTKNIGAIYVGACQYVTADDAAAGNKNNNASYRQLTVSTSGTFPNATYTLSFGASSTTQRQKSAIQAWRDIDSAVTLVNVDIPNDGRLIVGWKVTNTGPGVYHYEYAIENLSSDRSAQGFVLPIIGAVLNNIGFHDVDYHSGEPYSLTDWTATQAGGNITWETQTFATNANANALRWGTLYNFRFDATTGPQPTPVNATIRLFKPGTPTEVTVPVQVPSPADCNNNGILDTIDISSGTSLDCNHNFVPDECELATNDCNHNGLPDDCELAGHDCDGNGVHDSCQLANNDCDGNGVPDNCQPDCDRDGIIDACEIMQGAEDCNGNGVPDFCDTNAPSTTASPNLLIPDNNTAGVNSVVTYAGSGTVTDVNVTVNIPHTAVSQLKLTLTKGTTSRVLWNNRCGSFDNLNATFDDSGAFISCSNLAGTYTPSSCGGVALSGFNGLQAGGDWTLNVADTAAGDSGRLTSWTLNVTSTIPPTPPLPDVNHNSVPDSCEALNCKGDANGDMSIDGRDIALMVKCLTGGPINHRIDMDNNLVINAADLTAFINVLTSPNPPCAP